MAITQLRSKTTNTGSRYKDARKQKSRELGNQPTLTKVSATKVATRRVIGGNEKSRMLSVDVANVFDTKTNKHVKAKILSVTENPANRNFTRRNIITKGTILETEKGTAIVTSRPGQEGSINAVLQ